MSFDMNGVFMRVVCIDSPSQWVVGGDRSGGTIKHV